MFLGTLKVAHGTQLFVAMQFQYRWFKIRTVISIVFYSELKLNPIQFFSLILRVILLNYHHKTNTFFQNANLDPPF
jgi:hypothetical protein